MLSADVGIQPHAVRVGIGIVLFVGIGRYRHDRKVGGLAAELEPSRKVGNESQSVHVLFSVRARHLVVYRFVGYVYSNVGHYRNIVVRARVIRAERH